MNNFINNLGASAELKMFLKTLLTSSILKEQQLAMYILIEIKHDLLNINHYEQTIDSVKANGLSLNFDTFTNQRSNNLENECLLNKVNYSRIVSKDTFNNYVGDFLYDNPYIDTAKVKINGWSTRNKVVWVTPKDEINSLINSCPDTTEIANRVCDYLGLPRQFSGEEYVKIDYSPHFNDCVFQPNSSNILWYYEHILFVPIKKTNYFGKTYNENGVISAKEQIHKTSFFVDDLFECEKVGKIKEQFPINDNILTEAEKRFNS